jgi:hypothetical protein
VPEVESFSVIDFNIFAIHMKRFMTAKKRMHNVRIIDAVIYIFVQS